MKLYRLLSSSQLSCLLSSHVQRFEFFYFCKNKDQSLSTSLCDKLKEVSLSEGPGLIRLRSLFLIYFSGQQVTLNLNSFDFLKNVTFHDKSYLCP